MRLAIISDTHLPRRTRELPEACVERLRAADAILHAGDFTTSAILELLEAVGPPVLAVHGNADEAALSARLPEVRTEEVEGARIAMIHDAGPAAGRLRRMRRRFPDADAVIFGHSHIPLHERDESGGLQIFNPGSPTDKRRQPRFTMGTAVVAGGAVALEHVVLD